MLGLFLASVQAPCLAYVGNKPEFWVFSESVQQFVCQKDSSGLALGPGTNAAGLMGLIRSQVGLLWNTKKKNSLL